MTEHDEKLWKKVEEWRKKLINCEDYPVLNSLETAWLDSHEHLIDEGIYVRGERNASSPISDIMYHIEMGFYPPPELMLTMLECYEDYSSGMTELEEVFFGKRVQRLGNFAARKQRRLQDIFVQFRFSELLRDGLSRTEAAEKIVNEYGLDVDADSLLRKLRGFNGFHKNKSEN